MKSTPEQLEYWRQYREKNRHKIRQYYWDNRDTCLKKNKIWCSKNKDKRNISSKKYALTHKEKKRSCHASWVERNIDKLKESRKRYYEQNKEEIRRKAKIYYLKRYSNPEYRAKAIKNSIIWHKLNPDKSKKSIKKWCLKNKPYLRLKASARRAKISKCNDGANSVFERILNSKKYHKCYYCGNKTHISKVHLDHIVPIKKNGEHSSSNLCISCSHCNQTKQARLVSEWKKDGQQFLSL